MSENGASVFPAYPPASRAESLSKLDQDEVCIPFSPHGEQSSIIADSELDHVSQAVGLESKAEELFDKFGKNEDPQLIIVAIDMLKKTLELLPNDLPRRKRTYGNLSTLLIAYFQCSGDVAALDEALNFDRVLLDMLPFGDPGRPSSLASLARTLTVHYEAFGVVALLNEGIQMMKEAIQQDIDAESNKDPIDACSQLIHMLSLRYKASGDHEILDEAVRIARIVVEACTDAHPLRGKAYTNLGVLLMLKYESLGDIGILEEAIIFSRTAVNLAEEAPDKAIWLNNLAAALGLLYEAKGDTTLLDEIVVLENIARDLRPSGHPCHLTACTNLANARKAQYDTLGSYALLDEAIELERMVLRSIPLGDPHRSLLCSNLATSLGKRYETSGDLAFLHESIKLEREALTQRPEGHPERGTSCGNLGAWIYIRYRSSQNLDHLQEAVTLMRTALLLRNPAHGNYASLCIQLSIALRRYYDHTSNDATVLEEAVQLSQKAFNIRSSNHPDYGDACLTHAMALTHYDEVMDNTNHFDEIIALCQKGLPLLSNHRAWIPLLMLARMSVVSRGRQVDIHKAINYVKEAVAGPPCDIIGLAKNASLTLSRIHRLVLTDQQWAGLLPAYTHLIRILPLLAGFALDRRTQLHSQLPVTHLGSDAVTSAIAAGDFPAGLELLEQSRGVIWTQALHVSDPQTQDLPEELQVELRELLVSMAADTASIVEHASGGPNTSDLRHRRATRIQALLDQIRSMPGLERFMLGESHECLMQAAKDHLVVILIATRRASYALVLRDSTSLVYVPLEVRAKEIVQLWTLNGSSMSRGSLPLDRRGMKLSSGKIASRVELSLARIWSQVVQPIVSHLQLERHTVRKARPRIHWCPTGPFTFLPLHAAGIYHGPPSKRVSCSEYVVSSYIPSISSLLRAQKRNSIAGSGQRVLLISESRAKHIPSIPLLCVEEEVQNIQDTLKATSNLVCPIVTMSGSTRVSDVSAELQRASIVHLACHGIQNTEDALKSAFCLGDGDLTIGTIMDLQLQDKTLAFMSACETAKGDRAQPDQTVHLAAAMLHVGFKSVIATMWAIADVDGPMIARHFYEAWFAADCLDSDSAAYALDEAVDKLRMSGVPPDRWAPFIHLGA